MNSLEAYLMHKFSPASLNSQERSVRGSWLSEQIHGGSPRV